MNNHDQLRVGVAQFPSSNVLETNWMHVADLIEQAAQEKIELLVFPEACMVSFASSPERMREIAAHDEPLFMQKISEAARKHSMYMIVGVMAKPISPGDDRVTNQLVVVNDQGQELVRYTKLHLYDAFSFKESEKVQPGVIKGDGSEFGLFKIKDFTIGLVDCYDLRFPELSRALVDRGADVLSVSAAWIVGPYKETHWEILLRARAIENTAWVIASGQNGKRSCGQSMVIDPMGTVVAGAGDDTGLIVSTLTKRRLLEVRQALPCLQNRRLIA